MNSGNKIFLITYLLMILSGQNFAQWEKTNFPEKIKINAMDVKDSSIYAGTDGDGIFVSKDNGDNWNKINEGLKSNYIRTIFVYDSTIFAGTEDGAYISTNEGLSWRDISNGLSGQGVWSFAVSETKGEMKIFAGTDHGIYTSNDNGENWAVTSVLNTRMPVHSIVAYNGHVFAAIVCDGIYKSFDNGVTWTQDIGMEIKYEVDIVERAVVPVYSLENMDRNIIVGGYNETFYIYNYDKNIFEINGPTTDYCDVVLCFAKNKHEIFAGTSIGNIFKSVSQGLSWKRLDDYFLKKDGLINSLALNNTYLFAGTEGGVWRLRDTIDIKKVEISENPTKGFELEQNYPNPFNASTKIKYTVPSNGRVSLKVYDILGKLVGDLVDRDMSKGIYEVEYSAGNLPSGIYFYSLVTNGLKLTKKLILLK